MMSQKDKRILGEFTKRIRELFPDARVWAFGSRTRGQETEGSDLDVCVVVNSLDETNDRAIMDVAWEVGFKHDILISTITYSQQEIERGPCSESILVRNILSEGVAA
jgi:predicted nucleotidyltransferase